MASLNEKPEMVHRDVPSVKNGSDVYSDKEAGVPVRSATVASPWLNLVVMWAALSVFGNAYNVSIIASSLGQPTFQQLFGFATRPNVAGLISGAVGGNQIGSFVGQFIFQWVSDKYGRRNGMGAAACVLILGAALGGGCAAGNWPMFITARVLVGIGGWPLAAMALTYQNEVAITELRGWLTGTVGLAFGMGYAAAAWVGVGLFYYESEFAWRLPLILGVVPPLILLALLPFDEWLCLNGQAEKAYPIVERMHAHSSDPGHAFAKREFAQIKAQAEFDATLDSSWAGIFKKPSTRKRFWLAVLVGTTSSNTAIQVLTSYGPQIYAGFGFTARDSLLLAAGWISLAAIEPYFMMILLDKVGRRPLLCWSQGLCCLSLSLLAILSKFYGVPTGKITAGGGALIAVIYLHMIFYLICEAPTYVYYGEIWPSHLRAKGAAVGLASVALTAIWLTWATPYALLTITWKYWIIFAVLCFIGTWLQIWLVPETMNLPLEEIADLFGDKDEVVFHLRDVPATGASAP